MWSIVLMSKLPISHLPSNLHPSVKYYFYRSENFCVTFRASDTAQLRLSFFWGVKQHMLVVAYRRSGTVCLSYLQEQSLKMGQRVCLGEARPLFLCCLSVIVPVRGSSVERYKLSWCSPARNNIFVEFIRICNSSKEWSSIICIFEVYGRPTGILIHLFNCCNSEATLNTFK